MCAWRATRQAKNAIEPKLRIPKSTNTPTTMRMTLSAPPPCPAVAGGTEPAETAEPAVAGLATFGAGEEAITAAPHWLQNRIPGARLAPHLLQNAIGHLVQSTELNGPREYTADQSAVQAESSSTDESRSPSW